MTTELAKIENSYHEALLELHKNRGAAAAPWLERLRQRAMDRFAELGFPSVKDEEWKYTNVTPISRLDFRTLDASRESKLDSAVLASHGFESRANQLVFVNGVFRSDLSATTSLPEGAAAIELSQALADKRYAETVHSHLTRSANYVDNAFTALNTGLISQGAFVYIPAKAVVDEAIHLIFIADGETASFPRVLIVAGENSNAKVIESYASTHDAPYFVNAVVEVVLKDGAKLEHQKIQRDSVKAYHIATTAADLGTSASYDATTITVGAQLSRHDFNVSMDHEGAECWVDGLYLVTTGQHADTHSMIDHRKPHCSSHQLYKGILDGKSRAVFNGKVFVRHDAQKTDAMQTNKNLLLSPDARVDTKPQLEILADDVKCAHGAAVGQIDQDELFYLETRGIHTDLARNLLTYGFAEEVIVKIKDETIKQQLDEVLLKRLNARLEV